MQKINLYNVDGLANAQNIKNAIDTYGGNYFSRTELDEESSSYFVSIKFYIEGKEEPAMILDISKSTSTDNSNRIKLHIGNDTFYCVYNSTYRTRVYNMFVLDNAISIEFYEDSPSTASAYCFIISKSDKNKTLISFYNSGDVLYSCSPPSSSSGSSYNFNIYDLETGERTQYYNWVKSSTDNTIIALPFASFSGGTAKNVWISTQASFQEVRQGFKFTLEGESYVGLAHNYFIVKSE